MNEQYGGDNTPAENEFTKYGHDRYILDGHTPVQCPDLRVWGQWMETAQRHVARTTVKGCEVSTVFLGLDHAFGANGAPVVFETMVFGGRLDQEMRRYCTWDDAVEGHVEMCKVVWEAEASELEQAVKKVRDAP